MVPLDLEIPIIVRTVADPVGHVKRLELLHRVKGAVEYQRIPIGKLDNPFAGDQLIGLVQEIGIVEHLNII